MTSLDPVGDCIRVGQKAKGAVGRGSAGIEGFNVSYIEGPQSSETS